MELGSAKTQIKQNNEDIQRIKDQKKQLEEVITKCKDIF